MTDINDPICSPISEDIITHLIPPLSQLHHPAIEDSILSPPIDEITHPLDH